MTRRYRVERTIDAPRATVWTLLTDAEGYADWNDAVISIDGSIRQGQRLGLVSIADPGRTFRLVVEEMDEPRRMVWSDGMPLGLFTGRRTYTLADAPGGRTSFTMTEDFTGLLAGMVTRLMPDLTASFELFADSLRAAAEARL